MILLSSQTVEFTLNIGEILEIKTNNAGTIIYQRTVSSTLVENVTFSTGSKEVGPYEFVSTVNLQCTAGQIEFLVLQEFMGSYNIQKIKSTFPIKSSWNGGNRVYADDYSSLALAITAAGEFGYVLLGPKSSFTISSSQVLPEGIVFEGNGYNSSILNTNDAVPAFTYSAPAGTTKRGPTFLNLRIVSKSAIKLNSTTAIPPEQVGAQQGYIMRGGCEGVYFESSSPGGIAFEASTWFDGKIHECDFISQFNSGVWLYGSDLNEITHNRFQSNLIACIDVESNYTFGTQNLIAHNDIVNMLGSGTQAFIRTSDRFAIIKDNYIEQSTILSPIVPAAIRVRAGNNGAKPLALTIENNRLDININNVNYWLRFAAGSVPATLRASGNVFFSSPTPEVFYADPVTYWYDTSKRRLFFVRDQVQIPADFPFYSDYGLGYDKKYAYYFAPQYPGPHTNDIGTAMICRNDAFVIDNNSVIHPFQSVQQDGGRTGFTATITFIAKADVNGTSLNIMERNSVTGGAGLNYQSRSITDKKAKYTYLTSTAISDNFEILMIQGGAGDIEIYAIMVEYG